ncbi:Proline-rich protein 23D2 [Manis javanica]|nr:Proline-rich protein 23D2 [Manis javanica]
MDRRRRPRSPSEPQTERKATNAAQSRWAATQRNPASCRWTEQQPRTGAQAAAVHPAWRPDPPVALDPTQGQQIPGAPGMIVVVLEPGTDLELRLGDEREHREGLVQGEPQSSEEDPTGEKKGNLEAALILVS